MKIIGLSGKSGTGKSYNAMELCGRLNIDAMIDDGLFIAENRILGGVSAKKEPTKVGAVKTALFMDDEHKKNMQETIRRANPKNILILGTSDDMIRKIAARLELPAPSRIIQIDDITTREERLRAHKLRSESGTHVIPAPTFQVKRQFSGYFLNPLKRFRQGNANIRTLGAEKTLVRPTYSYLGEYIISDKVIADIVQHVARNAGGVADVIWVSSNNDAEAGLFVRIILQLSHGVQIRKVAAVIQREVYETVALMTNFNMGAVDVEIRSVKQPR